MNSPGSLVAPSAPLPRVLGVTETKAQRQRHSLVLCAFYLVGLLQVAPALAFHFDRQLNARHSPFPLWVQFVLLIAIVEFGLAISLSRIVDRAAWWNFSLLALALSMVYAFMMAMLLFAKYGPLISFLELNNAGRSAALYCLAMTSAHGLFAWIVGRMSLAWHSEGVLDSIQAGRRGSPTSSGHAG